MKNNLEKTFFDFEKCETVGDLNKLLKRPQLYGKIKELRELSPSGRLIRFKEIYDKTMKEDDLKRLNRTALEEFFPDETPKSIKDKPVRVKTGETLEKNITVYKIK